MSGDGSRSGEAAGGMGAGPHCMCGKRACRPASICLHTHALGSRPRHYYTKGNAHAVPHTCCIFCLTASITSSMSSHRPQPAMSRGVQVYAWDAACRSCVGCGLVWIDHGSGANTKMRKQICTPLAQICAAYCPGAHLQCQGAFNKGACIAHT